MLSACQQACLVLAMQPSCLAKAVVAEQPCTLHVNVDGAGMLLPKAMLHRLLGMQGVSEASERPGFFKRILDSNVSGIANAYAAAERLFAQLQVRHPHLSCIDSRLLAK